MGRAVKIARVVAKTVQSVRSKGLIATTRAALTYIDKKKRAPLGEEYDRQFGFDTAGNIALWTLVDDPESVVGGHRYEPVDELDLERALRLLDIDFSEFDFIDVGCGKGKALLVASGFGFRSLVGSRVRKSPGRRCEGKSETCRRPKRIGRLLRCKTILFPKWTDSSVPI